MTRLLCIIGFVIVLVVGVIAQTKSLDDAANSPQRANPRALPTYGPTEFTGNRACAGLQLERLEVHVLPGGDIEASVYSPSTPGARRSVSLVWPTGYTSANSPAGAVISDAHGAAVVRGLGIFENASVCGPTADGKLLVLDLGRRLDSVPLEVVDRVPLPSCGTEHFTSQVGPRNDAARRCFLGAYRTQRPAEFETTRLTVEGDPILEIYRVLSSGGVEVFVDASQDAWAGHRGWYRLDCPNIVASESTLEFGAGLELPGDESRIDARAA